MRALPARKLDRRITRVWRLSAVVNVVIWSLLLLLVVGILWLVFDVLSGVEYRAAVDALGLVTLIIAVLIVVAFVVFVVLIPKVRWMRWSFEVSDEEIDIHRGIFWRRRIIIPLIRVQNVDTRQGPIMRANGLASFTAATAAGEHEIPGLAVAEADALRDHVALLARIAQEDV
jgi:membrane protein YdbS with pleckstrin-like domain